MTIDKLITKTYSFNISKIPAAKGSHSDIETNTSRMEVK